MKRVLSLLIPRLKEFYRDKVALVWNIIFPIVVLFALKMIFSGEDALFKVGILNTSEVNSEKHALFNGALDEKIIQYIPILNHDVGMNNLKLDKIDLLIELDSKKVWFLDRSPKGGTLKFMINSINEGKNYSFQSVTSEHLGYIVWLFPGLLVMNIMFGSLFGVGYAIVRYRKNGVLKRLQATPLTALEFLLSQTLMRLIIIIGYILIVYFGCLLLFKFPVQGSHLLMLGVLSLGGLCLISLGVFLSSLTSSEEGGGGIINLVLWPMMFLTEVWYSLDNSSNLMKSISKIFPTTYILDSTRDIMFKGAGLLDIKINLFFLFGYTVIFLLLGTLCFKWKER